MSSAKSQVAMSTNTPNLSSGQQQKDYNSEESLGRQNSFGLNRRGNMKGKHLTRSHAMRESTSPPRTPTPRASESSSQLSPNGYQQQHMDVNESNNKLHTQSSSTGGNTPIIETPTVIVTSQHKQQQSNVALCNDTEFPKLSPPKSKSVSNTNSGNAGGIGSSTSSSSSNVNSSCISNHQRINNISDSHNIGNTNNNNKKTNGDNSNIGGNEAHNKSTNNVDINAANANRNYNQSQQQQLSAGNALQKALNVSDNTQSTPIYNSPMNYQLHPNDINREQQQQVQSFIAYEKENRCPRNDSQNSMNSNEDMHYETQHQQHQQQHQQHQSQQHHQRSGGGGKKHRTNSNSKGSKPRLKNLSNNNSVGGGSVSNMGAAGGVASGGIASNSIDGSLTSSNNTSGFISRVFTNSENSNEQYTDHGGTDLLSFFKETLNKNVKDRQFLLKIEKDLIEFVQEGNRGEIRFPQASSYNRMLIHRTAAFFGMEHNVDTETQQCVIVAPTKNTRIPDIRFKTLVLNNRDDSRKSILKRDTHSFDEARQSSYLCPDRGGMLDRKAKSFEEREEDYDRARSRIFNRSQNESCPISGGTTDDDNNYINWTSSVDHQQYSRGRSSGKVIKIQNSPDSRSGTVSQKSINNFGNYGASNQGGTQLLRGDSANSNKSMSTNSGNGNRIFSKQDSAGGSNTSWRLSPSSSGSNTQTQSVRSDSITPSTTGGFGSDEMHLPRTQAAIITHRKINEDSTLPFLSGFLWAVTDISNVPKGSILISPQTLQLILNKDGTVYHYDSSNMPPAQAMSNASSASNNMANTYQSNQSNSTSMHNPIKKQHKPIQQSQQQFNNVDSTTTPPTNTGCESVVESSTQTINVLDEMISSNNLLDVNYQEDDLCNRDENDECDNSVNGCLSITTTTSTKNYDRIEVQKFKNQATSPNIPINEKDEIKKEHLSQTPVNQCPIQNSQSQISQQSLTHNRDTPHSSRSTPFSTSDTLAKRSSEEPRTSWTQSYQAADGSTVFHTTSTPNSTTNPYCTTTYQQAPDGSIYAVPQGMIYAYPQPVEGEFQGYFMPVFDPSQQRSDTTSLLQPGTQAIYPTGGTTTMVPVAAYPTAQFTTTNGAPIYPSQVIYSGEQFPTTGTSLAATAPASATAQLQQIPMTSYPIGYPYPYNGYWGQTMTYYVPQQAVPATSLLAAPTSASGSLNHVAGGVNAAGPNGSSTTAGPSSNSSNNTSNSTGHIVSGNTQHASHHNGPISTGYQTHVHAVGGGLGSSHSGGTTYYGTGRIKRPTPQHFNSAVHNGGHQVITAATIPNGVTTATYQLGHAVPTLTLAAAAPPQTAVAPTATDLSGNGGGPSTTTMYALPQHATIFPANMFQYATNAAAPSIVPQSSGTNVTPQTAILQQSGNPQSHITGGLSLQASSTSGTIHNPHHSNTVITPFYTASHHHAAHPGIQSSSHSIHAPGPSAIPIVDPATITNVTHLGPVNNAVAYNGRAGVGGTSQSAPSTPHTMPSSSTIHHSQRNPSVFSTPPVMSTNGGNFSVNSTPQYYGNAEISHQASGNAGGCNNSNSPHNSYTSSHDKRNNANSGGGKKPLSYQSASLSRQNSTSGGGYNGTIKPSAHHNNANNNDTRASPSNSTNSRPHSIKRGGNGAASDKPQTPLLCGPPSFVGIANNQNTSNNSYQVITNNDIGAGGIPIVNVSKPPIRLNAAAAAFRQKGSTPTSGSNSAIEYRRNTVSQRNSPGTNASSNENSNNNSPNSIHNSSNAVTPIAARCYAPSYMINAQNNAGESAQTLPPSLYITTAPARGPAHIPPHLQSAAANGAGVPAAAVAATANVTQQAATAVLGGAAAADVANAAAVAAATVAHHHHHQPLLGAYNPAASGLYFKYGHTYFAHPSVALPNSRRSPSTDLRPPIAQMTGMYPTVNMMIPAQPRHPGRHPNPNYKGTRPR